MENRSHCTDKINLRLYRTTHAVGLTEHRRKLEVRLFTELTNHVLSGKLCHFNFPSKKKKKKEELERRLLLESAPSHRGKLKAIPSPNRRRGVRREGGPFHYREADKKRHVCSPRWPRSIIGWCMRIVTRIKGSPLRDEEQFLSIRAEQFAVPLPSRDGSLQICATFVSVERTLSRKSWHATR